jgi:hypothetical protein
MDVLLNTSAIRAADLPRGFEQRLGAPDRGKDSSRFSRSRIAE